MADIVYGKRKYACNNFDPKDIVNRSLVISGQSETGKSFVLNSILAAISKEVGRMYAFSSTATADEKFPMDNYTFPQLIRRDLDMDLIRNIHVYLENYKTKLSTIKKPAIIQKFAKMTIIYLYQYQSKFSQTDKATVRKLEQKVLASKKIITKLSKTKSKDMLKDEKDGLIKELVGIYSKIITRGCKILLSYIAKVPNPDLKDAYEALIFNPKTVIVINDLSSDLKGLRGEQLKDFQDLLDKGRHSELTIIVLLHDWACMRKELRNAVHNHIFTSIEMVNNFISIQGYKGELSKMLHDASAAIIQRDRSQPDDKKKFSMIFWMRLTGRIDYVVADPRGKQVPVGTKYYYDILMKKQRREEELF